MGSLFSSSASASENIGARKILVFGKSNVGKSSLVNNLAGANLKVGSGAIGCTFESHSESVNRDGQEYIFYDTAGFNEASGGQVEKVEAICNLIDLLIKLKTISLIVYVRRCDVISEIDEKNYRLIIDTLMENRVPTLCVNTYADNEGDNMNAWWERNKSTFQKHKTVKFQHGCSVIVGNPKIPAFVDIYKEYRLTAAKIVWALIEKHSAEEPLRMSETTSPNAILKFFNSLFGTVQRQIPKDKESMRRQLAEQGFKPDEIEQLVEKISTLSFYEQ